MAFKIEKEPISFQLWRKWYLASELDKIDIIKTLPGFEEHSKAVVLNSYLLDLLRFLNEEWKD